MSATRIVLVLIVLGTMASDSNGQLLPRRRIGRAIEQGVQQKAFEWAGKVIAEAIIKALKEIGESIGPVIDVEFSIELFAKMQIDPTFREKLDKDARSTTGWFESSTPGIWGYWIGDKCSAVRELDGNVYSVDEKNVPTNRKIESPGPWPGARANAVMLKELMSKGSAKVFLSETTKFTDK